MASVNGDGEKELKPFHSTQIVTEGNIHTVSIQQIEMSDNGVAKSIKVLCVASGEKHLLPVHLGLEATFKKV